MLKTETIDDLVDRIKETLYEEKKETEEILRLKAGIIKDREKLEKEKKDFEVEKAVWRANHIISKKNEVA